MSEGETFELASESQTVGPTEMARRIGKATGHTPTTQTIRNKAGDGTITGTRTAQGWKFEPAVVLKEWADNVPVTAHGGKRRNSGRKTTKSDTPLTRASADAKAAKAAIEKQLQPDEDGHYREAPVGAMPLSSVLDFTEDQLVALMNVHVGGRAALRPSQFEHLERINKLKRSDILLKREQGELVEASAIADAWAREQSRVREQVQTLPKRVGSRVSAACWVGDELVAELCRLLREHEVEGAVITQVADMLAKPASLNGRVRDLINAEIVEVMKSIAEGPPETNEGTR